MSRRDELEAELEYVTLEDEFLKAKERHAKGNLSRAKYDEVKERFHAARVAYRQARESVTAVTPAPARASASVNEQ